MEIVRLTSKLEQAVAKGQLPRHVGIIMDGNGRWAEARGLPRLEGHRAGSESVREVTRAARRIGLGALTLYAFSAQNWERPADEVGGLMQLLHDYLVGERSEILDNQIRLDAIGELDRLPRFVREPLEELRRASAHNDRMVLTLALSYGGREDILQAAVALAARIASREVDAANVRPADLERLLSTRELPPLDLVVRTSGEQRLSNFLLWQAAYAELVFCDTPWPDFRTEAFVQCLADYQQRERRFGLTSAQVRAS